MMKTKDDFLSIVVVGGSGNLSRTKIFPALFALYCQGSLPENTRLFGFARHDFSDEQFRDQIAQHLTCRYTPDKSCADRMREFLGMCRYVTGQYGSADSFLNLYQVMRSVESAHDINRIFYLAIPPSIFVDVARAMGSAGLVNCGIREPWSRVVIEKPFGRDRQSSDVLAREMALVFTEEQTYRIDHYLGKEVIQNLMVLRFANLVFEPVWNRDYIDKIEIGWTEDIGVEGRGGYFDDYGIIRDVIQNHLLQILALIAMEEPASADARHVRNEKVKVLRSIQPLEMKDLSLGQYQSGEYKGRRHVGYREDDSVPSRSNAATYAAATLRVNSKRWQGVPFCITAGKGMDTRVNETTIHFKEVKTNIFRDSPGGLSGNRLVVRIQPDEALYLKIVNKKPGLELVLTESDLNLEYQLAFSAQIPDAYECLLLDIITGDKSLFIRSDELAAAWDIFTPVLHEIEERGCRPAPYAFGSPGPDQKNRKP